jgi:hypothetical protein
VIITASMLQRIRKTWKNYDKQRKEQGILY